MLYLYLTIIPYTKKKVKKSHRTLTTKVTSMQWLFVKMLIIEPKIYVYAVVLEFNTSSSE